MCTNIQWGDHPIKLASLWRFANSIKGIQRCPCHASSVLKLTVWSSVCQGYNLVSEHLFDLILCSAGFLLCLLLPAFFLPSQDQGVDLDLVQTASAVIMIYWVVLKLLFCFRPWTLCCDLTGYITPTGWETFQWAIQNKKALVLKRTRHGTLGELCREAGWVEYVLSALRICCIFFWDDW